MLPFYERCADSPTRPSPPPSLRPASLIQDSGFADPGRAGACCGSGARRRTCWSRRSGNRLFMPDQRGASDVCPARAGGPSRRRRISPACVVFVWVLLRYRLWRRWCFCEDLTAGGALTQCGRSCPLVGADGTFTRRYMAGEPTGLMTSFPLARLTAPDCHFPPVELHCDLSRLPTANFVVRSLLSVSAVVLLRTPAAGPGGYPSSTCGLARTGTC